MMSKTNNECVNYSLMMQPTSFLYRKKRVHSCKIHFLMYNWNVCRPYRT